MPQSRKPLRQRYHRYQIAADQQQRCGLKRHRPRWLKARNRTALPQPDSQCAGHRQRSQPAQRSKFDQLTAGQIGYRKIVQVRAPHRGKRDCGPAQGHACFARCPDIEIVRKHQPANRHQQAEQRNGEQAGQCQGRMDAKGRKKALHRAFEQLDKSQRQQHRAHRMYRCVPTIDCKQAVQRKQPCQVARCFGDGHKARIHAQPDTDNRPQPAERNRQHQRMARRSEMSAPAMKYQCDPDAGDCACGPDHIGYFKPEGVRRVHPSARPRAKALRAVSASGSADPETAYNSWRNRDHIPTCGGNPRLTRHRDN